MNHVSPPWQFYARRLSCPLDHLEIQSIIDKVRAYTMVPDGGLETTIRLTLNSILHNIPGVLVECGTWRGGASFAMLLAQLYAFGKITRPVHMFDSFQGMSQPAAKDGLDAAYWYLTSQSGIKDNTNQNWCVASVAEVVDAANDLGLLDHIVIHKGWFSDTFKEQNLPNEVALLRIDCDWYDPVKLTLETFVPRISVNGCIVLDDYYAWRGCTIATHEYLAKSSWPIQTALDHAGAWFVKME